MGMELYIVYPAQTKQKKKLTLVCFWCGESASNKNVPKYFMVGVVVVEVFGRLAQYPFRRIDNCLLTIMEI